MDQARRLIVEADGDDPLARFRPRAEPLPATAPEKVVRLAAAGARDVEAEFPRDRAGGLTARDITHAIDVVHDAAQSIRLAEERARDGETRSQALLQRATEELKGAETRVQAAEARARSAEGRAQEAETRLREAEGWLRQIFAAISEELPTRR